jgi:AraC-like DNA-binding protein
MIAQGRLSLLNASRGTPHDGCGQTASKDWLRMRLISGAPTVSREVRHIMSSDYSDMRESRGLAGRVREDLKRLNPALQHVKECYARPIRVSEAARLCAMSQTYFMELFRQVTGQPYSAYLKRYRIGKAQELLITNGKTLSEISYETGFSEQSHFGAVFHQVTGTTPLAYRRSKGRVDLSV